MPAVVPVAVLSPMIASVPLGDLVAGQSAVFVVFPGPVTT